MKHISSLSSGIVLGTAGILMMNSLTGCQQHQQEAQNKFLVIEQLPNGKYKVVEEMPTEGPTRAIIRERDENGNIRERFMNEEEMKALAAQEYEKVQNGTSETVQQNSGEGMGLAGTILAVAAGSLLGNMIANSLMNNKAFSRNTRSAYTSSAYKQSKQRTTTKKSFFGSNSKSSTYRKSGFFGG